MIAGNACARLEAGSRKFWTLMNGLTEVKRPTSSPYLRLQALMIDSINGQASEFMHPDILRTLVEIDHLDFSPDRLLAGVVFSIMYIT